MAYIGNFPVSTGLQGVNFRIDSLTKRTVSASGRVIRSRNATLLFKGTLAFPPMTQAEFRPIAGFLAQAEGGLNEFDIVIPTVSKSASVNGETISGFIHVDGAHSIGDESINVAAGTGPTNIMKAGDLVRFANHTKVYMVSTDCNTDATGDAVLNIKPGLLEALSDAEDVTSNDVPIRMILSNDIQEYSIGVDNLHGFEVDVEETI